MSPKKTYVAVYERDPEDDAWNVHIQDLDGCQTYGRSLRQAQARIREALGLWLDRDPQQLVIRDELPADLSAVADTVAAPAKTPSAPARKLRRKRPGP